MKLYVTYTGECGKTAKQKMKEHRLAVKKWGG